MKDFLEKIKMIDNQSSNSVTLLDDSDIEILKKQLDSIKKEFLYESNFHGFYHSEKVMLFSYLIGKHQGLNDVEMQIVMDAAVYHDIGRTNDFEDNCHGFISSLQILEKKDKILSNDIYKDETNLYYLRAICDGHSKDDEYNKKIFDYYFYDNREIDYEQFKRLYDVLKDADALDRTRFKYSSVAALKEKFLRIDYSRTLIEFAKKVNELYVYRDAEELYNRYLSEYGKKEGVNDECACLHGIGSDFFKLESILNSGILSAYARKREHIDVSRNFSGSNGELWISVVDADMVSENGKALNHYIKNGISFFCFVPKLRAENKNNSNNADIINKNEYDDEKYVFERIDTSQIHSVIIPNKLMTKKVNELNYLICGTNYDTISFTVYYYKQEMMKRGFSKIDDSVVIELLNSFRLEVLKYENLSHYDQRIHLYDFLGVLDRIKENINTEIQKWFKSFYDYWLKNDNPSFTFTVRHVIIDLMSKYSVNQIINSDELNETVIILNQLNFDKSVDKKK